MNAVVVVAVTVILIATVFFVVKKKRAIDEEKRNAAREKRNADLEKKNAERVEKIAYYIFKNLGNVQKVEDAKFFISTYKKNMKRLKKELLSDMDNCTVEMNKNWIFRRKKKIDECIKKAEDTRTNKEKYEIENKNTYQNCQKILQTVGIDFYEKNKSKISENVDLLIQNASEKERIRNLRLQEEQERVRREMEENIRKARDERNKQIEEQVKKDKVAKSIRELESFLPTLQTHIREKQTLDFQMLKFIEDKIDVVEDNCTFVSSDDFNNIEKIQKKMISIFNKFRNEELVQIDINLIEESLGKILSQRISP